MHKLAAYQGRSKDSHRADALFVHCMDFRFQEAFFQFAKSQKYPYGFDVVSLAGGVLDSAQVEKHIDLAVNLHHVREVILCNHRACGAYGKELAFDSRKELKKHRQDLATMEDLIRRKYPNLKIIKLFADIEPGKNPEAASEITFFKMD